MCVSIGFQNRKGAISDQVITRDVGVTKISKITCKEINKYMGKICVNEIYYFDMTKL